MRTLKLTYILLWSLLLTNCKSTTQLNSENLIVKKLSNNVYQHISYLQTQTWGKVDCNGMIVIDNGEAVVFDTTIDNPTSEHLIKFIQNDLKSKVKAVVVTHFHEDCLGGLETFHNRNIPSFSSMETKILAYNKSITEPKFSIGNGTTIFVGKDSVKVKFFGEGHTIDNIVGYYEKENTLFGGCLIKELGAGKGNLADANEKAWSATVKNIKNTYPKVKTVIPGHGKTGNSELLDYTIKLFENQ